MATFYARKGLLGVMTPQANTTVEPETALLLPDGFGMIAARLTSGCADMNDRLIDYFAQIGETAAQFANAPVDAIGFACTGASYLVGPADEAKAVARVEADRGIPLITAGRAIADALRCLSARRIGVVSPYGDALTEACVDYWTRQDLVVIEVVQVRQDATAFHPIYAHSGDVALDGLRRLERVSQVDAVVILGTGLPSLTAIAASPYLGAARVPVLSSGLCLAWRLVLAAMREAPSAAILHRWLSGDHWKGRLARSVGTAG